MNEKLKYIEIKSNFKYPVITGRHYRFGSNIFDSKILREDGDWRDYLPQEEEQYKNGVESSACYIEGQQHGIATILEERFNIINSNFSSRFNSILSDGTESGGDPLKGAESITKDGLIDELELPFSNEINTWDKFHSFYGSDENRCRELGKEFLNKWKLNYDIVFDLNDDVATKYSKLREALKRSPVPMSVYGWVKNENDVYVKPHGRYDNHLVLCVYLDDNNCPYVWDTYSPFLKKLEPMYNSDFAMRWWVEKKEVSDSVVKKNWLSKLIEIIINFLDKHVF